MFVSMPVDSVFPSVKLVDTEPTVAPRLAGSGCLSRSQPGLVEETGKIRSLIFVSCRIEIGQVVGDYIERVICGREAG